MKKWSAGSAAVAQFHLPNGERSPLALGSELALPILLMQDWDDPFTRSYFAARLDIESPFVTQKKVPAVSLDSPCLDGKEAWGSHIAVHPCHPEWTRDTVPAFLDNVVETS